MIFIGFFRERRGKVQPGKSTAAVVESVCTERGISLPRILIPLLTCFEGVKKLALLIPSVFLPDNSF